MDLHKADMLLPGKGLGEKVRIILRMIKFEHTLFALPLAFSGTLLAVPGWPSARVLLLVLTAMIGARSAAMAFNRLADASLDALNPRTAAREIPIGAVKNHQAALFTIASSALFLASAYFLNPLCFLLSPLALALVLFYSYTKRFTPYCHLFLGLALGLAPLGGWIAATGSFSWRPVVLAMAVLCWVAGFDILYSCLDLDFDRQFGLHSLPVFLGAERAFGLAKLFHAAAWLLFLLTGWIMDQGVWYFSGIMVVGALLVMEHRLVHPHDLTRINAAFFTTNSLVSIAFFAGTLMDKALRLQTGLTGL